MNPGQIDIEACILKTAKINMKKRNGEKIIIIRNRWENMLKIITGKASTGCEKKK